MCIIGITGTTGSGKTVALDILEQLGALALDCDEMYHRLLAESKAMVEEIASRFNGVSKNGAIDRELLGKKVFTDKTALNELNNITHKYVIAEINRKLAEWEEKGGEIAAIDAIALIESGINELCDITVGIIAPTETRIDRIMKRDGIARERAKMRINAQQPDSFYIKYCDHILENSSSSIEEFKQKCKAYFTEQSLRLKGI